MEQITIFKNEANNKRYIQIPEELILDYEQKEELEELWDVIIAELRRGEPTVSLEELKAELKAEGNL